jgi:hypothetical protein
MRLRRHKEKGDGVQIIHANFVNSSVVILREIPKIVHHGKVYIVGEGVDVDVLTL